MQKCKPESPSRSLMRCNALKGVILTAGGKGRDESIADAGCGDGLFGKGVFDRRIHLCWCVFYSHHSERSGAVPKTFFEILSLSREAGADRGRHFVKKCSLARVRRQVSRVDPVPPRPPRPRLRLLPATGRTPAPEGPTRSRPAPAGRGWVGCLKDSYAKIGRTMEHGGPPTLFRSSGRLRGPDRSINIITALP